MSQLFAGTSELYCMSAKCSYSPKKNLEKIIGGHPVALVSQAKDFINITSEVFHCHAPGKNLLECRTIPCIDQL